MEVSLLGLGEELGLPSLKNNKQNFETRLLDKIEKELQKKYNVKKVNTFSYKFNKTWHMSSILKNNLTLNELEKLRRIGNEFAKKESIMMNIFSPKIIKENYENIKLSEFLNKKNVILYDIGMNDFMYHSNQNIVASHILFHKNKQANEILKNGKIFDIVLNETKESINNILKINPNSKIYLLGFSLQVYVPKLIYKIYKNSKLYKYLNNYIDKWNSMLKSLENENVIYIDLSIYKNKLEALNDIHKKIVIGDSYNSNLDSKGIEGMISDLENDQIHTKENKKEIKYLKKIAL